MAYPIPGMTLKGVVNANVRELVTQFGAHLLDALTSGVDMELDILANMTPTDALVVKIPINILALNGFEEWSGERDYIDVDLVAMAIEAREWTRNVGYNMRAAMSGAYGGFPRIAAQTILEGYKMQGRLIANILKKGKTEAKTYQGIPLFVGQNAGTKHLINPLAINGSTFINLYTDRPFTGENFQFAQEVIESIPGPDGEESLGLKLTHVVGGTRMRGHFKTVLKKSTIMGATRLVDLGGGNTGAVAAQETNIWEGEAEYRVSSLLNNDPFLIAHPNGQVWYATALNMAARPVEMMGKDGGAPQVKVRGEGDPIADQKKKVLVEGDLEINAAAGLPHTIIRFEYEGEPEA